MAGLGRKKKNEGKLGIAGICLVVIIFGIVMYVRTKDAQGQIEELNRDMQKLEEQLKEEELRSEELEEKKVYVKTKMYVEEMAKKLGLVYPDEIIYRPSDN
ncbi:MAG: septum formation initiator family protein [Lachnospiraceae bacterium]